MLTVKDIPEDYKWDGSLNVAPDPEMFIFPKGDAALYGTVTVITESIDGI